LNLSKHLLQRQHLRLKPKLTTQQLRQLKKRVPRLPK